jgi:hypothetical protein
MKSCLTHAKKCVSMRLCFQKHPKLLSLSAPFSHFSSHSESSTGRYLVRYPPVVEPLQVAVLAVWTNHSPTDWYEQNVKSDGRGIQDTIDYVLHTLDLIAQNPVGDESKVEDGEV